jgi:hypothetical protein
MSFTPPGGKAPQAPSSEHLLSEVGAWLGSPLIQLLGPGYSEEAQNSSFAFFMSSAKSAKPIAALAKAVTDNARET